MLVYHLFNDMNNIKCTEKSLIVREMKMYFVMYIFVAWISQLILNIHLSNLEHAFLSYIPRV